MKKKKKFQQINYQPSAWEDDRETNWPLLVTSAMLVLISWWFIMHIIILIFIWK